MAITLFFPRQQTTWRMPADLDTFGQPQTVTTLNLACNNVKFLSLVRPNKVFQAFFFYNFFSTKPCLAFINAGHVPTN